MNVLVAYATRNGSTRGVAERLAMRLRVHGLSVDAHGLPAVVHAQAYDAIVVGSAVYSQAWLPAAAAFIRHQAIALTERPIWTFSVGRLERQRRLLRRVNWPDAKDVADVERWARPRGHAFFAGAIGPAGLWPHQRLIFRLAGGTYGDFRDWTAIEAWADGIAEQLAALPRSHPAPA